MIKELAIFHFSWLLTAALISVHGRLGQFKLEQEAEDINVGEAKYIYGM